MPWRQHTNKIHTFTFWHDCRFHIYWFWETEIIHHWNVFKSSRSSVEQIDGLAQDCGNTSALRHRDNRVPMGLLPDTENCGMRMRRECRERFPRHRLQGKPLVSDRGMHHGTWVTHVPWCMSGLLTRGGGENVPGIPGACATRNFSYLVRGPWSYCSLALSHRNNRVPIQVLQYQPFEETDQSHRSHNAPVPYPTMHNSAHSFSNGTKPKPQPILNIAFCGIWKSCIVGFVY